MNADLQASATAPPLPVPTKSTFGSHEQHPIPSTTPVEFPSFQGFCCPSCNTALAVAEENIGEAIDCSGCGVAVVSPDPIRGQPAILFSELLAQMGIAPVAEKSADPGPQRQIAEFQLRISDGPEQSGTSEQAEPDPMAWLEDSPAEPAASTRKPLWPNGEPPSQAEPAYARSSEAPEPPLETPNHTATEFAKRKSKSTRFKTPIELTARTEGRRRRDPRTTPLRIAAPSSTPSRPGIPMPFFTGTELTAAAVAVIAVGAISYALFFSPTGEENDIPVPQPKTVVVTQPSPETPTGEDAGSLAVQPTEPLPNDGFGFEINDQPIEQSLPDQSNAESPAPTQAQPQQPPNKKILHFEKSRDALRAFCAARTPEDRLQFVFKPDVHEENVHRYHDAHGPAPFQLRELIHGQTALSKDDGRYWSNFLVQTNKNPRGFTVTVRETDSGPRLSWPAFVQHHDGTFETFLEEQPADPTVFCASISRGYSVDPNAPDPKKYHCFRLRGSESPRGKAKAYVDRKSYLGEQLERNVDWDSEVPITVEVQWQKDQSNSDAPATLFIREVLEYHW